MKYGYVRCKASDDRQEIQRQVNALKDLGAEKFVLEYEPGDARGRYNLQMLLDYVREGDVILTLELDRLPNTHEQLCKVIDVVRAKRLCLKIVDTADIDCRPTNADAKAAGRLLGRRAVTKADIPSVFFGFYLVYVTGKMTVSEMARACKLSRPTVYKYLKIIGERENPAPMMGRTSE